VAQDRRDRVGQQRRGQPGAYPTKKYKKLYFHISVTSNQNSSVGHFFACKIDKNMLKNIFWSHLFKIKNGPRPGYLFVYDSNVNIFMPTIEMSTF
jgi:hypothetical protein